MLCQTHADYHSAGGDSGAPVFSDDIRAGNDRWAAGVHWGGGNGIAVSSQIGYVRNEIGNLYICPRSEGC